MSPCLETARAAGKAIGRRPCHRPVSSPLTPPLPGAVLHLSALPVLAARALAWRITLRRLALVVALLFNVSARPVASHCRHRPPRPTSGQPLHRAELLLRARAVLLLCSLSMHRLHFASLIPYCIESPPYPPPLPFSPQSFNPTLTLHRFLIPPAKSFTGRPRVHSALSPSHRRLSPSPPPAGPSFTELSSPSPMTSTRTVFPRRLPSSKHNIVSTLHLP